jgi:glutamate/tyrosine decarboxylase-like PLP-dependent enzyme
MANFTGLAAARDTVLHDRGWDVARDGLLGGPRVRVIAGAERHSSIDMALRYLGLGHPELVPSDEQGRIDPVVLREALGRDTGVPTILCLQAGNVHSGSFDPFEDPIAAAHEAGAWVHVDGAFGLWAAATPALGALTAGLSGADSWATDAHKTLNVPYDCAMAIVRDRADVQAMFRPGGDYLIRAGWDAWDAAPELSRRARGVPVWAALRSLGSTGVAELVERLCARAQRLAAGLRRMAGVTVLNEVGYTQVLFRLADDASTRALGAAILAEGTAALTGAQWRGDAVLRCSVSSWATTEDDVDQTLAAIERLVSAQRAKSNP